MLGISKPVAIGLAALGLLALAGLGFWRGVAAIEAWEAAIDSRATERETAKFTAEIEKSNTLIANARVKQAEQALAQAEALAAERQKTMQALADLETVNARLPDAACLDADRVRELRRARRQD